VKKFIWSPFLILIFVLSVGSISYAWWLFQIEKGNQSLQRGDSQKAEEIYREAKAPFRQIPLLTQLFKSDYQSLVFNRIGLLYANGQIEEVLEKLQEEADHAPFIAQTGEYSFWMGNVLLRKAIRSKVPEDLVNALEAARGEYRRGLTVEPDDWDLKYNYELVLHMLSQKGRGKIKMEKVKSILEKMKPLRIPHKGVLQPEKQG